MTAYISISYSKRKFLQKELDAIADALKKFSITPFVFVDNISFSPEQENEMMRQAFAEIDKCGLLIAETSDKAIGIGIELGYAKAKNKPVIYVRNKNAEHSTTAAGSSDYKIIYSDTDDLRKQLSGVLKKMNPVS
jgi:2'-deoxynucleoside 5'-phosphate N-hydrolase